jgi:hypothetical protein
MFSNLVYQPILVKSISSSNNIGLFGFKNLLCDSLPTILFPKLDTDILSNPKILIRGKFLMR